MRSILTCLILTGLVFAGDAGRAAALLEKGEARKAAETAQKLVAADAKNVDAWVVLIDALLAGAGDAYDAWDAVDRAVEANPEDARILTRAGDVYTKVAEAKIREGGGNDAQVRAFYMDAVRQYDAALARDPKAADALYGKAYVAYATGEAGKAKKLIADCIGARKDHAGAFTLRGDILYAEAGQLARAGKGEEAISKYALAAQAYETARKLDDSKEIVCLRYGHALYGQGKKDEAKAAYIYTLERHPEYEPAITSGLLYLVEPAKDYRKAVPILTEAAKEVPGSGTLWFHLGRAHFANAAYTEALEAFRKAEKRAPEDAYLIYYIGFTHEKQGNRDKALARYKKALQVNPGYAAPAYQFQGLIPMESDFDRAEQLFEELLALAPEKPIETYGKAGEFWGLIHNNYALVLRNWAEARGAAKSASVPSPVKRRIKRSSEVYEIAASILTEDPQIQSDTGLLFEFYPCNRNDGKAREYFTRALELSEYTYRDAFAGLDRLCRRTGDWATLKDYAEGVLGAIERGKQAVAPVGGGPPRELPHETARLKARAQRAVVDAERNMSE